MDVALYILQAMSYDRTSSNASFTSFILTLVFSPLYSPLVTL